MYIGLSTLLLASGAILRFAVDDRVDGVDLAMIGTILMVVGVVALIASLLQMAFWSDRRRTVERDREAV